MDSSILCHAELDSESNALSFIHCVWRSTSGHYLLQRSEKVQGSLELVVLPFDLLQQDIRMVPQLITLLADQVEGVVVVGCQLVPMKDHNLSLPCQLLCNIQIKEGLGVIFLDCVRQKGHHVALTGLSI